MNALTKLSGLDGASLIVATREVGPILAKNAAQADKEGRVQEENLSALRKAGLLSLGRPAPFAGLERALSLFLTTQSLLDEACSSTSWVTGLGNVAPIPMLALLVTPPPLAPR